jgi:DNA-binding IclR family transcriptional regulator
VRSDWERAGVQDLTVKTVDRVAAILRALAEGGEHGVSLTGVAESTGIAKPTVHRLLSALANAGFAFQQSPERIYRLGSAAVALGQSALHQHAAAIARPALERLAAVTGDTAFASVREGTAAVCVARAVGDFPIRTLTLDIGDRRPLGVGAGSLALLAALPDDEINAISRQNAEWLAHFSGFAVEMPELVARTRRDGFALNEGRIVPAMNAVAVVARDAIGRPFVALSLAAIRDRMDLARRSETVTLLKEQAAAVERTLSSDARGPGE